MPTYEGTCGNESCTRHGSLFEFLVRKWTDPNPKCPSCDKEVNRYLSAPAIVWAKDVGQYLGQNSEGHWAHARDESGTPVKHFIRTRKDQKDFCKRYGYYDPNEIPESCTADENGVTKKNTSGEKGQWI